MSSSSLDPAPRVPEPLTGFVGDVGGAHVGGGIFNASGSRLGSDFFLGLLVRGSAAIVLLMLVALVVVLIAAARPSIHLFGAKFLTTSSWRPNEREITKRNAQGNIMRDEDGEPIVITLPAEFGALSVIYGTAVSSALALLIAVPMSLGAALFLVRIGPWLTPTFVKCGILGMLLTVFLILLMSNSAFGLEFLSLLPRWAEFVMLRIKVSPWGIIVALVLGITLTGVLMRVAWTIEDPRLGTRWSLELPVYVGIWLFAMFLFRMVGLGWAVSFVSGLVTAAMMFFLAPSIVAIISFLIEFLAAIPSIAYGIWGLFVVAPFLQTYLEPPLNRFFDWVPFLRFLHTDGFTSGRDMFCAGLILAIMILPIITAISRDILRSVPRIQIEGTQALGATWWQSSWAMLRYGRSGLFGAVMLGLARAAGETMAVAMVIGNDPHINYSIFKPAQTMAGLLANEFAEASTDLHRAALIEVALILLVMSLAFNIVARFLVVGKRARSGA